MKYDIGDMARFKAMFTAGQVAGDPTGIKIKIKSPSGTTTEYEYGTDAEVVKDEDGYYHCDFTFTEAGTWWYRWEGTGAVIAAEEASMQVVESEFYD